jgi:hypothetical protein
MRSVADELRRRARESTEKIPVAARVELALRLGDDDLELFCRAQGLDRQEALRQLRIQRQKGRRPSVANRP